jgi:glutathione S-transferase
MFAQPKLALGFNNEGVPAWEDRTIRSGWPLFRYLIRRVLRISPGIEREDEAAVWRELDYAAELLADGRPYLCGERFGAADLTFAAMSAAVILPPEYAVTLPQLNVLAAPTAALVERARAHPAGRYALSLFADYRRAEPSTSPA